jgi:glutathione S-transferase
VTAGFKLYGRLGSGSAACEAVLALTGPSHEVFDLDRWPFGHAPAGILAISPLGQVPALVLPDGSAMTESAAICLYLADLVPGAGLAPLPGDPRRAAYLRWMVYLAANNYMTGLRVYYPERYSTHNDGGAAVKAVALQRAALEWSVLADALSNGPFVLGDSISAADIYAAMLLSWDFDMQALFKKHPALASLYAAVASHPKIAAVWRRHDMPV